jgi:hypothetical protein
MKKVLQIIMVATLINGVVQVRAVTFEYLQNTLRDFRNHTKKLSDDKYEQLTTEDRHVVVAEAESFIENVSPLSQFKNEVDYKKLVKKIKTRKKELEVPPQEPLPIIEYREKIPTPSWTGTGGEGDEPLTSQELLVTDEKDFGEKIIPITQAWFENIGEQLLQISKMLLKDKGNLIEFINDSVQNAIASIEGEHRAVRTLFNTMGFEFNTLSAEEKEKANNLFEDSAKIMNLFVELQETFEYLVNYKENFENIVLSDKKSFELRKNNAQHIDEAYWILPSDDISYDYLNFLIKQENDYNNKWQDCARILVLRIQKAVQKLQKILQEAKEEEEEEELL